MGSYGRVFYGAFAYATRSPLAAGRLQITDDEQLTFRLKTPWSDGTTHLLLSRGLPAR